jgi:hypothetical protein
MRLQLEPLSLCLFGFALIKYFYRSAYMRNSDRAANNQRNVQSLKKILPTDTFPCAANNMIRNAIVAPQDGGGYQSEQLFGLSV